VSHLAAATARLCAGRVSRVCPTAQIACITLCCTHLAIALMARNQTSSFQEIGMKKWLAMLAAASCALSFAALAADAPATKAPTAQQQKMTTCNAEAKTKALKGDERKAFMKEGLSAKKAAAAPATQQDKMKTCNADAKTKKLAGDARKAFMKECLSGAQAG